MKRKIEKNPKTDADVHLLHQVFSDVLPDGRTITHAQIEAALRLPRLASRYRTVVNRWRRELLHERRVWLDGRAAEGQGFIVLTPDQMVRYANREVRSAGRKLRKAIEVAATPNDEELSEQTRRYRQLLVSVVERVAQENRSAIREISRAMRPMTQLPRASGDVQK